MPKLTNYFQGHQNGAPKSLQELRLGKEPSMVLLFTEEAEDVLLHYEKDEAVRSFVPCPGKDCPLCYVGSAPQKFLLLPVYNIETCRVEVLRIPTTRGPETLVASLLPLLKDPNISNKLFLLSRNIARYRVEIHDLSEDADRGIDAIQSFMEACGNGLKLVSAFPQWSAKELAGVERIRRKLDACGGYSPSLESPVESEGGEEK